MSSDDKQPPGNEPPERDHSGDEAVRTDSSSSPMRVVGIGASAGGLGALKKLFATVPEQPGVCFVVVVHLSPEHESHLANLLQQHSRLPVQQVTDKTPLTANHIYVIPPDFNIDAIDTHLHLSELEEQRHKRAPIDHFFRTLAEAHKEHAVGVILTGTGADGTFGLRRIRERGGLTIVQSPDEAEYDAMPRSAIAAGVADLVLPIEKIAAQILRVDGVPQGIALSEGDSGPAEKEAATLHKILSEVSTHTGHDFTHYKRTTIMRRIGRRMQLHHVQNLDDYLRLLHRHDDEVKDLLEDLLITVTQFFRDPEVFEHLETKVIPQLFKGTTREDRVRVWSVGCATGEEAYSLAMLLLDEEARHTVKPKQLQVFATDIHEAALGKAREGIYPVSIEADVSDQRLSRFFEKGNEHYRIRKAVRERIVFAPHNVLRDPPFSRLQLISCRNLLIYLQRDIQQQLMSMFHYALEEDGYLVVGTSEGVESDLFQCENKQYGLYRRRSVPGHRHPASNTSLNSRFRHREDQDGANMTPAAGYGVLHEHAVELYAPPSILIDPDGELVHYSARAGRFLHMAGGTPTNDVFRLLPEPLKFELRTAVHTSRDNGGSYRSRPISLLIEGTQCQVVLRVQRVDQPRINGYFLVIFDEIEAPEGTDPDDKSLPHDANIRGLEAELTQMKKRMQSLIEEHEAAQERNQAYNEELESTNEELRSTMEELETSKEEMQSINEELTTLNQENHHKVEELNQLSSDLENLLTATHIATVFLDRDLHVLRFTPSMASLFNLTDSDRGKSMADLAHQFGYGQLKEDVGKLLKQLTPVEREISNEQGQWYLARLQCYRTNDDRIEGVVITFIDITKRKEFERELLHAKDIAERVIDTVRNPMLVLSNDLRAEFSNKAFEQYFKLPSDDIRGLSVYDLDNGPWKNPHLREVLERILPDNRDFNDFEIEHTFDNGAVRSLIVSARRIDHLELILLACEDVTERKQARQAIERSRDLLEEKVAERTAELHQQSKCLRHLVRDLTSAELRERKRMASVLHDDLQQILVAVKMQLGMARTRLKEKSSIKTLDQAIQSIDESINITRDLVRRVTPQVLYEHGLIPALKWLSEEMSRRHGLKTRIKAVKEELPLPDASKTLIFDSLREMLFNIVKHANVDSATVEVRQHPDRLSITVSDEGSGFDVATKAAESDKSHFGVFSIDHRIEAIGGTLTIDSAPGKGTRVCLEIPVTATSADDQTVQTEPPAELIPSSDATERDATVVRVLVADDHALVREGIVQVLKQIKRMKVVGEAGDGIEAIAGVDRYHPDVVLMDVNMPRMDGVAATREIRRRWPQTLVIGLSMQEANGESVHAITEAGATAFLPKSDNSNQIVETIFRLMNAKQNTKKRTGTTTS